MKEIKRYLRKVHALLPYGKKRKDCAVEMICQNIQSYMADYPEKTFSDIQDHFGTPEQIAREFVGQMDTEDIQRELCNRKRVIAVLFWANIVLAAGWLLYIAIRLISMLNNVPGKMEPSHISSPWMIENIPVLLIVIILLGAFLRLFREKQILEKYDSRFVAE